MALDPQRLNYLGLNTCTPQPATPAFHQRGYQIFAPHRHLTGPASLLTSQFSYKEVRRGSYGDQNEAAWIVAALSVVFALP